MSGPSPAAAAQRRRAQVEFALGPLDDVAHASTAPLGAAYTCLQCRASMTVVRAGSPPHFRHAGEAACDGSSVERRAGARLLVARLRRELSEHGGITTWSPCRGPGNDEPCPDDALIPTRRALHVDAAVVSGSACPPPADVAIVRGAEIVIGFALVSHAARDGSAPTAPERAGQQVVRFALGDVLAFRALVPLEHDVAPGCCPTCRTRVGAALTEGAGATSEFLDAGFVREAARVHAMWRSVLVAAGVASAAGSAAASGRAREAPSTTRRQRVGPW